MRACVRACVRACERAGAAGRCHLQTQVERSSLLRPLLRTHVGRGESSRTVRALKPLWLQKKKFADSLRSSPPECRVVQRDGV